MCRYRYLDFWVNYNDLTVLLNSRNHWFIYGKASQMALVQVSEII